MGGRLAPRGRPGSTRDLGIELALTGLRLLCGIFVFGICVSATRSGRNAAYTLAKLPPGGRRGCSLTALKRTPIPICVPLAILFHRWTSIDAEAGCDSWPQQAGSRPARHSAQVSKPISFEMPPGGEASCSQKRRQRTCHATASNQEGHPGPIAAFKARGRGGDAPRPSSHSFQVCSKLVPLLGMC